MEKTLDKISEIYDNVFCNIYSKSFYIFLCGGTGVKCIRNSVRIALENRGFNIFYPEDLFMSILNRNKDKNLLEFENLLADNSDCICVICESMGSAVELGAFVANNRIKEKMIAAVLKKYDKRRSFITMGPLKLLRENNKSSVIVYQQDDIDTFCNDFIKSFNTINKENLSEMIHQDFKFNKLTTFISFIPLILYFYKETPRKLLFSSLKSFLKIKNMLLANYNDYFNATINYLTKSRIVIPKPIVDDTLLELSNKGFDFIDSLLKKSILQYKSKTNDKIRIQIMKNNLCNNNRSL